jgi:hypothetical protein
VSDRRLRMIRGSEEFGREVLATLDAATVGVHIEADPSAARQVLAEALVDILARLFPRIAITGADGVAVCAELPPAAGGGALRDRLEAVRAQGITPQNPGEPDVTVVIGAGEGEVFCDGSGWQSYLGPVPSLLANQSAEVPVGALAAACRAAARVFGIVMERFGEPLPPLESVYWSGLTYKAAGEPIDHPETAAQFAIDAVLAGAGSVGGAAAYTFARVPQLAGELDIVDPQALEPHNPDRAILATEELASARAVKVDVARDALAHLPLEVRKHQMTLEEWVAERPREARLPLVLCSFDEIEPRRELQDCLPLEVANAACSPDGVMLTGHRTGAGPCIYCVYIAEVLDTERITFKLIVEATGLGAGLVQGLLEQNAPLASVHLEEIEDKRGFARGTLQAYQGRSLIELYEGALMYGEREFEQDDAAAAVATPFVTALAGVLLAAEALKAGVGDRENRLGPWRAGRDRYDESLAASAANAYTSTVPRWPDARCLCRSTRRERILRARYGLNPAGGAGSDTMN